MIADAINSAFAAFWANVVYYATFQFLDPFWGWLCIGLVIIAVVWAVCHFFGDWIPILKPIAGVIVLLVTFGLFAYRKGENDTTARIKLREPKPKPPQQQSQNQQRQWPWQSGQ